MQTKRMDLWTQCGKESVEQIEGISVTYTHYHVEIDSYWEAAYRTGSSALRCGDLEERDIGWGRREAPERQDVYTHIADSLCCMAEINTIL